MHHKYFDLLINGLFNDAFNRSKFIALNERWLSDNGFEIKYRTKQTRHSLCIIIIIIIIIIIGMLSLHVNKYLLKSPELSWIELNYYYPLSLAVSRKTTLSLTKHF